MAFPAHASSPTLQTGSSLVSTILQGRYTEATDGYLYMIAEYANMSRRKKSVTSCFKETCTIHQETDIIAPDF
jgi:hypothetical protein